MFIINNQSLLSKTVMAGNDFNCRHCWNTLLT